MSFTYVWFTGDQVAFVDNIGNEKNKTTTFEGVDPPFESTDLIRIKLKSRLRTH